MAVQRQVAVASGSGYTDVLITIAGCHYMKIWQNSTRDKQLDYKLGGSIGDNFATIFTTQTGDFIELIGHGRSGILGKNASFLASGQPVTGDIIIKLHSTDGTAMTVNVVESESEL